MVKWLTRRSAKPISAGSNPALGSYRELAQWLARKSYILTVSGSSPKHEGAVFKDYPILQKPDNKHFTFIRLYFVLFGFVKNCL